MRISVAVTPKLVAPPLSPTKAGAHVGEYTDSIWRAGVPKHGLRPGRLCFFDGAVVVVADSWLPPAPAVRLAAWRSDSMIASG